MGSGATNRYVPSTLVDREDAAGNIVNGDWRADQVTNNLLTVHRTSTNTYGKSAENMRESLMNYLINKGAILFQWNKQVLFSEPVLQSLNIL